MLKSASILLTLVSMFISENVISQEPILLTEPRGQKLFVSGQGGYHTYRIPSIAVTTEGTILAVCEGRKNSSGDSGDIDLLIKRSEDDGKTWSKPAEITEDVKRPDWTWYATGPGSNRTF